MSTTVPSSSLSIADVARATGTSAHTLRYYERAGLIAGVDRASSGHRRYDEDDLRWIEVLQRLRATGMPIRDVRRYAELVRAGEGNERDRFELLVAHRDRVQAQLAEVARHLEFIERKLAIYAQRSET
jgi:DNA-binding transcriptional MerR regulator